MTKAKVRHLTYKDILAELEVLEKQYGMSSEEFYKAFIQGKLGHRPEFVRWAGLWEMAAKAGRQTPAAV